MYKNTYNTLIFIAIKSVFSFIFTQKINYYLYSLFHHFITLMEQFQMAVTGFRVSAYTGY